MQLGTFSISLAVKDLKASREFYEKFGFKVFAGNASQNWLILKKRYTNTSSHFLIVGKSYAIRFSTGNSSGQSPLSFSLHACAAKKATLLGRNPCRVMK